MMNGGEMFLNPYTFVPAFSRDGLPEPLGDGPPPSRERLHADRWTGRVGVILTVETPLLLLDTERAAPPSTGEKGHLVYPVRLRNGRPHLPATSVKGMLRAAYEAVTNSRFGVFENHGSPLAFRRGAGYAQKMVPVYIAAEGVLLRFEMASLRMYDKSGQNLHSEQEAPAHLERLRAVVGSDGKNGAEVVNFVRSTSAEKLIPGRGERLVNGIAYVTGPNIEGKRCERFFYPEQGGEPKALPLAREWSALVAEWDRLIRDYRDAHGDTELRQRRTPDGRVADPGERVGDGPGLLAWSPHIHDRERMELKPRTLCYAHFDEEDRVDRLYPVLIPRDLYPVAPEDLLDPSLLPAPRYEELSPADRVFGWVAPRGGGTRPAAYRGRLRVGPVTCDDEAERAVRRFGGDGLPLAILGAPKPQQGRFYLSETADRPDLPIRNATPKEELYRAGRGLRGRKMYWHHAGLDAARHWSVEAAGRGSGAPPAAAVPVRTGDPSPPAVTAAVAPEPGSAPGPNPGVRPGPKPGPKPGPRPGAGPRPGPGIRSGEGVDPAQVLIGGRYREYLRPRTPVDDSGGLTADRRRYRTTGAERRDTQNRSVGGWVTPGTIFRFTVEVRDLDDHELGALAWLLTLPQGHFHRLGLGRPLGFGSVRLDIDAEAVELHTGAEYTAYYRSLSGTLPDGGGVKALEAARETFDRMMGDEPLSAIRDAVLAVSRGNPGLPVHYPRTRPGGLHRDVPAPSDPRGRSYEWFTENERLEGEEVAPGRGRSLPGVADTAGPLGVYPAKDGGDERSGKERRAGEGRGKGGRR